MHSFLVVQRAVLQILCDAQGDCVVGVDIDVRAVGQVVGTAERLDWLSSVDLDQNNAEGKEGGIPVDLVEVDGLRACTVGTDVGRHIRPIEIWHACILREEGDLFLGPLVVEPWSFIQVQEGMREIDGQPPLGAKVIWQRVQYCFQRDLFDNVWELQLTSL